MRKAVKIIIMISFSLFLLYNFVSGKQNNFNQTSIQINKKIREKILIRKGLSLNAPEIISPPHRVQGQVLFSEDFEAGQGEWYSQGDLWEIGPPIYGPDSAFSGTKVAATNLSGNYPDDADAYLISPPIILPKLLNPKDKIRLHFWQWYETESSYDECTVMVSNDNGVTWTALISFDGDQEDWRLADIDLSSYAEDTVRINFYFHSDQSINYAGWYIDAITVEYVKYLGTEEIEIAVAENGQFTMGIPDGPILLYGHPDPWSSATTIRIDGVDYWNYNGSTWGTMITPPTTVGLLNTTTWDINGLVHLTQSLSIVKGSSTDKYDTGEIRYTVVNTDNVPHSVGIRIMLDTMLGTNDGAPFRIPGTGAVTTETEWDSLSMPPYYQAFDDLTNPTIQSQGTLIGGNAVRPNRFCATGWQHINDTPWEYVTNPGADFWWGSYGYDSAVGIYWFPVILKPGETKEFVTYYGLGGMDIDLQPPLVTALTAPNSMVLMNGNSTNTFTLTVYLSNTSPGVTQSAHGVATILSLPDGLELPPNENARHDLPDLDIGKEYQTSYQIKVKPTAAGQQVYSLWVGAENIPSKTVQKDIYIFGIQTNPPNGGQIHPNDAITAIFNIDMDANTINAETFIVSDGETTIDGVVNYDETTRTIEFKPNVSLESGKEYYATLKTAIKSLDGIELPYDVSWKFVVSSPQFELFIPQKLQLINDILNLKRPYFGNTKPFFELIEKNAKSFVDKVNSDFQSGNVDSLDLEAVARLTLSEKVTKQALIDAIDISDYGVQGLKAITFSYVILPAFKYLGKWISKVPIIGKGASKVINKVVYKIERAMYKLHLAFFNNFKPPSGQLNILQAIQAKEQTDRALAKTADAIMKFTIKEIDKHVFETSIFDLADNICQDYTFLSVLELQSENNQSNAVMKAKSNDFPLNKFNIASSNATNKLISMIKSNQIAKDLSNFINTIREVSKWTVLIASAVAIIGGIIAAIFTGGGSLLVSIAGLSGFLITYGSLVSNISAISEAAYAAIHVNAIIPYVYLNPSVNDAFGPTTTTTNNIYVANLNYLGSSDDYGNQKVLNKPNYITNLSQFYNRLKIMIKDGDLNWVSLMNDSLDYYENLASIEEEKAIAEFLGASGVADTIIKNYNLYVRDFLVKSATRDIFSAGLNISSFVFVAGYQDQSIILNTISNLDSAIVNLDKINFLKSIIYDSLHFYNIQIPPSVGIGSVKSQILGNNPGRAKLTVDVINYGSQAIEGVQIYPYFVSQNTSIIGDTIYTFNMMPEDTIAFQFELFSSDSIITGIILLKSILKNPTYYLLPGKQFAIEFTLNSPAVSGTLNNKNVYAYPNPFNPEETSVIFRYKLKKASEITIKIYDSAGKIVKTVTDNEHKEAQIELSTPWDGRDDQGNIVSNGVYFYVIESSSGEKAVGKIAVLR